MPTPMENKIPKDTFALLLASSSKNVEDPVLLGVNIGKRISEDYFLRSSNSKIPSSKVPENISQFFSNYFSYTPRHESNILYLEDFYGLKYDSTCLLVFKGMFEEIYRFKCEDKVEIVVDEGTKTIMIK